jgi:hypothetical protein
MHSDTSVHEIADGIYRIATPIRFPSGEEFSFNQYLVVDEMPLLFHTGYGESSLSYGRRWAECFRWRGCATSGSPTSRRTSAAR